MIHLLSVKFHKIDVWMWICEWPLHFRNCLWINNISVKSHDRKKLEKNHKWQLILWDTNNMVRLFLNVFTVLFYLVRPRSPKRKCECSRRTYFRSYHTTIFSHIVSTNQSTTLSRHMLESWKISQATISLRLFNLLCSCFSAVLHLYMGSVPVTWSRADFFFTLPRSSPNSFSSSGFAVQCGFVPRQARMMLKKLLKTQQCEYSRMATTINTFTPNISKYERLTNTW